jgi:iron-sulfur cluster assembly protein
MRQPLTITDAALDHVNHLLSSKGNGAYGLRIGLRTKGCSGLAYTVEFASEKHPHDEEMVVDGVHLLIEPKAIMYLIGTEMDYVVDKFQSGFVFRNPNEKGRCGCGKSFHV